jgi:hypothetical protein
MENETMTKYLDEIKKLPEDFDWKIYLIKNVDLILAGINNEEQAIEHYFNYGAIEYRIYYENHKIDKFVYCGGKCGSSTLYETIRKNNFKTMKLHTNLEYKLNNCNNSIYDIINQNRQSNQTIYFIDSYRTPIERKMSSFFYHLKIEKYDKSIDELVEMFNKEFIETEFTLTINYETSFKDKLTMALTNIIKDLKIDEISDKFIKLNVKSRDNLNILCNIFDNYKESLGIISYKKKYLNNNEYYHSIDELFRHFNISETFTKFDFDKKYAIHQHGNMVFIKIRFRDINDWGKILSDIFGKEITMFSDNLTENKEYRDLYNRFKAQYKVPKSFIKELLKDEHFNAYNTIEERRQYIKYWMDRSL